VAITEQALTGVLLEAEAAGGVSTPATQDGAWVTSREHPWRRSRSDGRIAGASLVEIAREKTPNGIERSVGVEVFVTAVQKTHEVFRLVGEIE